jgi:LPPG:FO 2-phospho-L-lactate transferase
VRGAVLKGPTAEFMRWAGQPISSDGIAAAYSGLIDGLVADEPTAAIEVLETEVLMDRAEARRRLAEQTIEFASGLDGRNG